MNILGMGSLEVLAVLLVAFIFLGPDRMVEAARFLGKMAREARRMTAELPDFVLEEDEPPEASIVHRRGPSPGAAASDEPAGEGDGPVAFRREPPTTLSDTEPDRNQDAE